MGLGYERLLLWRAIAHLWQELDIALTSECASVLTSFFQGMPDKNDTVGRANYLMCFSHGWVWSLGHSDRTVHFLWWSCTSVRLSEDFILQSCVCKCIYYIPVAVVSHRVTFRGAKDPSICPMKINRRLGCACSRAAEDVSLWASLLLMLWRKRPIVRSSGLSTVLTVLILSVVLGARTVDNPWGRLIIWFVFTPQPALSEVLLLTKRKFRVLQIMAEIIVTVVAAFTLRQKAVSTSVDLALFICYQFHGDLKQSDH